MQIIDLFSGIGGFSIAGHWCNWSTVQFCESEPFCVDNFLKFYFPDVPVHPNIKLLTYAKIKENKLFNPAFSSIITGGFPCQPYSNAGKRKGTADDRNLWPSMLRIIQKVQPLWVVAENVPGLVTWSNGMVFEQVQADLEAAGYEVTPFLLPACGVNAPHRRDRIWFVGRKFSTDTAGNRIYRTPELENDKRQGREWWRHDAYDHVEISNKNRNTTTADTEKFGVEGNGSAWQQIASTPIKEKLLGRNDTGNCWANWPSVSPLCSRNDGLTSRLHGITFSAWRKGCMKALGNGIVPEVAYPIFLSIMDFENELQKAA